MIDVYFEKVKNYENLDIPLPTRKTAYSAGYDFMVAEDIVVPSYLKLMEKFKTEAGPIDNPITLCTIAQLTKDYGIKPTLVPTVMKCYMKKNQYLEISVRSSCPLKYWLVMANGTGKIDSDYVNNPKNDGHIYFQLINLSPFDILLKKGNVIGQGIIHEYCITGNDNATGERKGGFGSTDGKIN